MTYLGEHLYSCRVIPFQWSSAHSVIVSGSGPNICGHALVNAGLNYFHIDGLNDYPWMMDESGYKRYLRENRKKELFRRFIPMKDQDGAQRKIEQLSAQRWRWLLIPNNCAAFVEEVLSAGGSDESILSNCPVRWK